MTLPSLLFPQAFHLTAISLDFCNTFAARLGQACKKHLCNSQHRNNSENALITGYFQHVAGHLASASCWTPCTHIPEFKTSSWTWSPEPDSNRESWIPITLRELLVCISTCRSSPWHCHRIHVPPGDRCICMLTSCCDCFQFIDVYKRFLESVHFAKTWTDWKIASGLKG